MVRLTVIGRLADGLPLAEGLDNDTELSPEIQPFKSKSKILIKRMSEERQASDRISVDAGKFTFHILIDNLVVYLTLTEKQYPKKLAFQYLEELSSEFIRVYGTQIENISRPYAFVKFGKLKTIDTFIQKTRKLYMDSRTQRNLSKLNEDINEVHQILTKSMQEVLGHGEKLDTMTRMSNTLAEESKMYAKKAKNLYSQALVQKYIPIAAVIGIVIILLYARSWLI